jgi:hypothetical protein
MNKTAYNKRFGEIGVEVTTRTSVYPLTVGDNPNCVQSFPNFAKPPDVGCKRAKARLGKTWKIERCWNRECSWNGE